MGEVLIAGTASLLICVFLSPKFIEFLRAREFGQQIREEGPQEHHAKAGTPTMGGIIIFTAIAVPFVGPVPIEPWLYVLFGAFAIVAASNGVNLTDGLDGLAGSLVLGIVLVLAAFVWTIGDANAAKILIVLAGALSGFLFFNLPWPLRGRHRTFMGDAGSMVAGFAVAWFSVALTQRAGTAVAPPIRQWWRRPWPLRLWRSFRPASSSGCWCNRAGTPR